MDQREGEYDLSLDSKRISYIVILLCIPLGGFKTIKVIFFGYKNHLPIVAALNNVVGIVRQDNPACSWHGIILLLRFLTVNN